MVYIDFHCHLDWDSFDEDRELIVNSMKDKNIVAFSNTVNFENYKKTLNLFKIYDNVNVCPGLYPQNAEDIIDSEMDDYLNYLREKQDDFLIIGEVGLDKHHTKVSEDMSEDKKQEVNMRFENQKRRFKQIIEFAIEVDKPLCIHARKSEQEVLEILEYYVKNKNFRKFNLHCFSGKKKLINKIKELKIYCSIPMTLFNTQSFQILVEELPVRQLLVETDSPFLNPEKTRNSPLNVPLIYDKIAEIKGLDKKEIESIIYQNYMRLIL